VISLFDKDLKLREGKVNLLIWPDRLPDTSIDSMTPGLITDPNVDELGFYNSRLEAFERQQFESNVLNNKCLQALRNQVYYAYRKIPAAFLEIEFPLFEVPVLYEDVDLIMGSRIVRDTATPAQAVKNEYYLETNLFSNNIIFADYDQDNHKTNPIQEQYLQVLRFNDDARELKPRLEEIDLINKILIKASFGSFSPEEKLLIWKYRYYLSENKEALPKFLQSVNWQLDKESKEALRLLDQWAPIDYENALSLLSYFFCANDVYNRTKKPINKVIKVREYATKVLANVPNERINFILLQLVQALRYEPLDDSSPLLNFLIKKGCTDPKIATTFYWHLRVEVETNRGVMAEFFQMCLTKFEEALVEADGGEQVFEDIRQQAQFRDLLKFLNNKIKPQKKADKMKMELRKLLKEPSYGNFKAHPMSIEPNCVISSFNPDECSCFKSAMVPLLISLNASKVDGDKQDKMTYQVMFKNGDDLRQDQLILQIIALTDSLLKGVNIDLRLTPYRALACGKDDGYLEFVPQSMDLQAILKENNNDLTLFFKGLALKAVENPESWFYKNYINSEITKLTYENAAQSPDHKKELINIAFKKILENYIDSCAGYCVITYILGIGDRHLENLMINTEGKFFHIDFGWILGRDPKPYPPPFKLCKQMVEGMGGFKSAQYENFRKKCVVIYQYLRNYARLITNLFHLMLDSGLPHLDENGLEKLWESFKLDESNEAAENAILALIDESVRAIVAVVVDYIHVWAGYLR
jgi:phosphatidylinositol 3-kinase